jgi:hypothetical protein
MKHFLNPPSQPAEILRRLTEVDLLERWGFRLDQDVVADQGLRVTRPKTELVHGVRVDQTIQLVFALRFRVTFGGGFQFSDEQVAFIVGFDEIDYPDKGHIQLLAGIGIRQLYRKRILDGFNLPRLNVFVKPLQKRRTEFQMGIDGRVALEGDPLSSNCLAPLDSEFLTNECQLGLRPVSFSTR